MDIESIKNTVIHWNNLDVLPTLPDNSVDAIVTDPPYGLSFMWKKRDYDVPSQKLWEECLRVLKPWWYLLAFAGTRTQHRMAVRIEDAGFEIRDMIAWVYGSGFPKSLNIGKAVDKLQGNERKNIWEYVAPDWKRRRWGVGFHWWIWEYTQNTRWEKMETKWNTPQEWRWTALKPALEPITVARKPISEKTVAENVLKWGTGGINIDGSRVGNGDDRTQGGTGGYKTQYVGGELEQKVERATGGRFPANFIHDGSDEVVELFPSPHSAGNKKKSNITAGKSIFGIGGIGARNPDTYADSGSASRFFYCAKASKSERNRWCDDIPIKDPDHRTDTWKWSYVDKWIAPQSNSHPTVKPIALMEYLVKLVSKEWAIVLDPFAWSGSTLVACKNISRNYIGMEMTEEYIPIIEARLNAVVEEEPEEDIQPSLF